jgi:hypothetical protein
MSGAFRRNYLGGSTAVVVFWRLGSRSACDVAALTMLSAAASATTAPITPYGHQTMIPAMTPAKPNANSAGWNEGSGT